MGDKYCYIVFLSCFCEGREDEGREENGQTWKVFSPSSQNYPFWAYILINIITHSFFGALSSFLLVHSRFTPSEGPKGFVS